MMSFRKALAQMIVAGIAGEIGDRKHRDRRIADGLAQRHLTRPHGRSRRRRARLLDRVDVDGLGKILQARLTHRTQQQAWRGLNRRTKCAGHEDAAGIGHGLEARRDVDAMAVGDGFVKRHVADIEPDAELDQLAVAPDRLVAEFGLDLNRELQCRVGAVEQRQNSIAGDCGDLAAIVADQAAKKLNR